MGIVILLTIFFVKCLLAEMEENLRDSSMVNEFNHVYPEIENFLADSNNEEEDPLLTLQFIPRPMESHSDGNSEGQGKVTKYLLESGITSFNSSENSSKLHRFIRADPGRCKVPEDLKDSRLDCTHYPSRVSCKQKCIFGHTLKGGPERQMKCKHNEGRWTPTAKFEKCKPYVDCGITLGPGGNYLCYTNYMNKAPKCEISCQKYEDKSAVEKKTHQCDINGNWSPKLPFCAKAGSGLKTVDPPADNGKTAGGNTRRKPRGTRKPRASRKPVILDSDEDVEEEEEYEEYQSVGASELVPSDGLDKPTPTR